MKNDLLLDTCIEGSVAPLWEPLLRAFQETVARALAEDLTPGDLTSQYIAPPDDYGHGEAIVRQEGVIAGMEGARQAFLQLDPTIKFEANMWDGQRSYPGNQVFRVSGDTDGLLAAERTALNLMQRLSGVATLAARYVKAVEGTGAIIVDTRKTTPGLRPLEKYAVRLGGARNHRYNLSDGILIKDNHIAIARGVKAAVERVRAHAPHTLRVEVEVTNNAELDDALAAGADCLLLDNMMPSELREAVKRIGGRALTEASGGIDLTTVREVAETGVNFISVGAITHSAPALDISLRIAPWDVDFFYL